MKSAPAKHTSSAHAQQQTAQKPLFHKQGVEEASYDVQAVHSLSGPSGADAPVSPVFHNHLGIQTKLTIGQPGDKYEQEADTMAEKVVQRLAINSAAGAEAHSGTPAVQAKCAECAAEEKQQGKEELLGEPDIQRKAIFESNDEAPAVQAKFSGAPTIQTACAECGREQEEPEVQTKPGAVDATPGSPALESQLQSSRGGGSPLPDDTRSSMESAFGSDFSDVRVHADSSAAQMNDELGAQAFTHGSDIYFGVGKYNPGSAEGRGLLAHELTHTVQQGSSVQKKETPDVQRYWGEGLVNTVSGAVSSAGSAIADTASDVGGAVWDATGGAAIDFVMNQLRERAPGLFAILDQIRSQGVVGFFKAKMMEGVNGLFNGLQNNSGMLSNIFPQFGALLVRAQVIVTVLASGDCKPLFAAINDLKNMVTQMAGDAWDAIMAFCQPTIDFFTNIWETFAMPALEWLQTKATGVWNWIKETATNIWNWFQPLRDAISGAWDYIKGILGLNADETGEEGLIQWAQRKAGEVWEMVKEEVRPILEPARAMVEKIKAFIPLNAIFNLRAIIQDWLQKIVATSTAMGEDASNVGNEVAQTSLRDQILPAVQQSLESFRGKIGEAAAWVSGTIGDIYASVGQFFSAFRNNSLLSFASGLIGWVETQVSGVYDWVQSKVAAVFDLASQGVQLIGAFLRPVYDALVKIADVLGNILGELPNFIMGPFWWILPQCIKDPIKDFFLTQILYRLPFFQKLMELEGVWERIKAAALVILKQVFVDGNLRGAIWTFFSTMLDILGLPPQLVMRVIAKGAQSLSDILSDPLGFLGNFLRSLKLGFEQFFSNIGTHLLNGLQAWLFGQLEGTGIEMPQDVSFKSMLKLVFQILGITVDMLLEILEEVTGKKGLKAKIERVIGAVASAWEWFEKLVSQVEEGGSFWDRLSGAIGNIWDIILNGVVSWLETTIVVKALAWIAKKLDPTGIMAIITTVIDVFNLIEAIMDKAREILEMIERVLDGIADIIKGVIATGANVFERALAAAIPVALAIISAIVGLDGVIDRVKEVIEDLREKVKAGITRVVTSIKNWIMRLFGSGGEEGEDSIEAALREIDTEGEQESDEGEVTQDEAEAIKNKVNQDHSEVIEISSVKEGEETWDFEYVQRSSKKIHRKKLPPTKVTSCGSN